MASGAIDHRRILDCIPREWLTRYLGLAAIEGGMTLRLLDIQGGTLLAVPADPPGDEGGRDREDAWSRVGDLLGEGFRELDFAGKSLLMAVPLSHRGERLGYLAACAQGRAGDDPGHGRARALFALASHHFEGLADSGYEVESLSGEVVRVYEELALIYRLTERLGTEVRLGEIFRVVVDEAEKVLHPSDIVLQLADEERGVLRTVFASGAHREQALSFAPGVEAGVLGRVFTNRRSVVVSNLSQERQEPAWPFPAQRLLAVPLVADNRGLGVIFATDKVDGSSFDSLEDKLFSVISSVAAIAIKNAQLYGEIRNLFDGFINASVTAVESRDPTTAGHSTRVAAMTVELAKLVAASELPPFRNVAFSGEQLLEIRYAGLLHDFGKIGVRESVLLKEAKLFKGDWERIRERFDYIGERRAREAAERKLAILLAEGQDAYQQAAALIDADLARGAARLEDTLKLIQVMNDPRVLLTELPEMEQLDALTERHYTDPRGERRPYITPFEFNNLHVLKGSLNDEERREIESHVTHSFNFLSKIPWTRSFSQLAEMVYCHHEKLDGSGYPRRLTAEAIPMQAKMMAVADIFDALTAWDRPYKKAVSVEKALFILDMEAREGKLDANLVRLFKEAKVYALGEGMK